MARANPSPFKIAAVDTAGNVTYSLLVGIALDALAGLTLVGIIVSRAYAAAMNSVTGGPYGWWREKVFQLTHTGGGAGRVRRTVVDLLAFNTFQVPIYATAVAIASLVSEGAVHWGKVGGGAAYLASISPLIGPTMGWFIDGVRRLFGVPPASARAYRLAAQEPEGRA